jgi:hypothetical protein
MIKKPFAVSTALRLLELHPNWYFFRIDPGTKAGGLPNAWNTTANTNDPKVIEKWSINSNVGLALKKSGLIAFDVDVKAGKRGATTLGELELDHGAMPETYTVRTGSGGFHYYYTETDTAKHVQGNNKFGKDIDCPGFVLIAGCEFEGKFYETVPGAKIGRLTSAPEWFADYLFERPVADIGDNEPPVVDLDIAENIKRGIFFLKNDAKPSIQGSGGEKALLDVGGTLKDLGISEQEAVALLDEHYNVDDKCIPLWPLDELTVKVHNAYTYLRETQPGALGITPEDDFAADPLDPLTPEQEAEQEAIRQKNARTKPRDFGKRRRVKIIASEFNEAMDQVQRIVGPQTDKPDPIFKRNGRLVHLSRNLTDEGIKLKHFEKDALIILDASKHWVATRFEKSITFMVPDGEDDNGKMTWRPINAPLMMVDRILGDSTNWLGYPVLQSTIETPTLRKDGTVLDEPGYDVETGLFFDPGDVKFPPIENRPTIEQGKIAIEKIADLLVDFPFADNVSKAVAMSLLLTSVVRRTMDTAPIYFIDADDAEAGKTTLAKIGGALSTGRDIEVQAYAANVEERDKLLPALLLCGSPYLLFDNLPDGCVIEGAEMEKIITSPTYQSRPFGKNDTVRTMPTNATMVFTGNKMGAKGAMTTRGLLIRIVPDKPLAERTFTHDDIVAHTIKLRPPLVAAILTALRAYLVHGAGKVQLEDRDRFPDWSKLIRSAVIWYGYADPLRGGDKLRVDDPVKEAQREAIRVWWRKFADGTVLARDLARTAETRAALAEGLDIPDREVNGIRAGRYVDKLINVRLDLPVDVVQQAKVKGEPQRYNLELKPSGRADWADDADDKGEEFE